MSINEDFLSILACPVCKKPLQLSEDGNFESAILWEQNSDDFINYLKRRRKYSGDSSVQCYRWKCL